FYTLSPLFAFTSSSLLIPLFFLVRDSSVAILSFSCLAFSPRWLPALSLASFLFSHPSCLLSSLSDVFVAHPLVLPINHSSIISKQQPQPASGYNLAIIHRYRSPPPPPTHHTPTPHPSIQP